jgi:uncharacterized protein YidB (DUF937 family)
MGGGIEGLIGMLAGGQGGAQGLGTLVERLRQAGLGEQVDSWVGTGANRPVAPDQLQQAFGPEALQGLAQRLGLGGGAAAGGGVAAALAALLPQVINGLTPQGRVPQSDAEFGQGGMAGALAQVMGAMGGGQGAAGGGLAGMLGGLLGGAGGAQGQGGGGLGALLGGLMGGGVAPADGKPGLGGDGGAPYPRKPPPLG